MKKRLCLFLSLLIVFSLLLSACSNDTKTDESEKEKNDYAGIVGIDEDENGVPDWQEKEIELVYANNFYGENDETNPMVLNIKKFMEKYPNITVTRDRQFTGEMDDFEKMEVLTARASEGTLPDVFYSPLAAEAYDRELTLDLTPYIESDEEADSISDNARSFMMSYDGEEIYGVPWMSVSQFPAINLKLLKENNISIPSYDWTYEEWLN